MRRQEMWTWVLGGVSVAAIAVGLGLCASPGLAVVQGPELERVEGAGCITFEVKWNKQCSPTWNCTEMNFAPWVQCQKAGDYCDYCEYEQTAYTCVNATGKYCAIGGTGQGGTPGCLDCGEKYEGGECTAYAVCGGGGYPSGLTCEDAPQCNTGDM